MTAYTQFDVSLTDHIAHVRLSRPHKLNAMNEAFWRELPAIMRWVDETDAVRVVVLTAEGAHFSTGIDLALLTDVAQQLGPDPGRNARVLRQTILRLQEAFTAVDVCRKPVLAAIQGHCIGGAVDFVSACDLRYCTQDAQFAIKEVDMGMTADVGTLQRLPRILGDGVLRELAYTGRAVGADEALRLGLVNRVEPTVEALLDTVFDIARQIAAKSPVAIEGTKRMLDYMRDHRIDDGLDYVATWNAAMLQSSDLRTALAAHARREVPRFED